MSSRKAFITGGAGFIGRSVVERCLREGMEVTVFDNLCAGKLDNIVEFMDRITFVQADILDVPALSEAMREATPDVVLHLAAHHFIPFCNEHPEETLRVNVEGTYAVLNQAVLNGVPVAVVASTGGLYPSIDDLLHEEVAPAPPDVYGLSKMATEQVVEFFARTTPLKCVAARLFNAYGPYETNPHLLPHVMESLREGPVVTLGNIVTKRDYVYVEDVASMIVALSEAAVDAYTVVNVGTGTEYSAKEIIDILGELTGAEIRIDVDQSRLRPVDKLHQRADTAKLARLTGKVPAHGLHQGLTKLLRHENLIPASLGA